MTRYTHAYMIGRCVPGAIRMTCFSIPLRTCSLSNSAFQCAQSSCAMLDADAREPPQHEQRNRVSVEEGTSVFKIKQWERNK
jgi:hypothetical protein